VKNTGRVSESRCGSPGDAAASSAARDRWFSGLLPWAGAIAVWAIGSLLLLRTSLFGIKAFLPVSYWYRFYPFNQSQPGNLGDFGFNPLLYDMAMYHSPLAHVVSMAWRQGVLPLWNPFLHGGEPLLAAAQSGVFNILNVPIWFFPWPAGYAWAALAKLAVVWFGGIALARRFGLQFGMQLFLAAGFVVAPGFLSWMQHPLVPVLVWFPWLLWAVEGVALSPAGSRDGRLALAWIAAFCCLALYGSHPESAFNIVFASYCYSLVRLPAGRFSDALKSRLSVTAAFAGGVLLSAPAIVPFVDYLFSSTVLRDRMAHGSSWVVAPECLRLFWNPFALGSSIEGMGAQAWSGPVNWCEDQQYVGLIPWALVLLGLPLAFRAMRAEKARLAGVAAMALPCAILAYGIPPVHRLLTAIPPFSANANPRLAYVVQVSLILAASLLVGSRRAAGGRSTLRSRGALLLLVCGAVAVAGIAVLSARNNWAARPAWCAAAAVMVAGACVLAPNRRLLSVCAAGAFVVLVVDTLPVWKRFYPVQPAWWALSSIDRTPPQLAALPEPRRVIAEDMMAPNTLALLGLSDLRGYNPPPLRRHKAYMERVAGLSQTNEMGNITRDELQSPVILAALLRCGGQIVATSNQYTDPFFLSRLKPVRREGLYFLYEVIQPAPFAEFVPTEETHLAAELNESVELLRSGLRETAEPVVVETGRSQRAQRARTAIQGVAFQTPDMNSVELSFNPPPGHDGYTIVRIGYDSGWRAVTAGGRLEVLPAQAMFLAVKTPAGTGQIRLEYWPRTLTVSFWIGGISFLALLGWCVRALREARKTRSAAPAQ
jgi:hypothetical protein